jgi:hypothetical protein
MDMINLPTGVEIHRPPAITGHATRADQDWRFDVVT